jgi:hypothetical protein
MAKRIQVISKLKCARSLPVIKGAESFSYRSNNFALFLVFKRLNPALQDAYVQPIIVLRRTLQASLKSRILKNPSHQMIARRNHPHSPGVIDIRKALQDARQALARAASYTDAIRGR